MLNSNSSLNGRLSNLKYQLHNREQELKKSIERKAKYLKYNNQKKEVNPIIGVTGLAQWLINNWETLEPRQLKGYTLAIAKSSDQVVNLVNNMLDLAHITCEDFSLNLSSLSLNQLLKAKFKGYNCASRNIQNQIEFITDTDEDIIVNCNKYLIDRSLDNLILSISALGEINFTQLVRDETHARIIINYKQTGSNSVKFDEFWNDTGSDRETTEDVGLALVSRIAELHEGAIKIENSAENTKNMVFELPL